MLASPRMSQATAGQLALAFAATSIPASATPFVPPRAAIAVSLSTRVTDSGLWRASVDWGRIERRIESWAMLPAGWDGRGGRPPSAEVVDAALTLTSQFQAANLPAAEPFVAGDGELGFRWRKDDGTASVCLLDDGCLVAYVPGAKGQAPLRLDEPFAPVHDRRELIDRLRAFA